MLNRSPPVQLEAPEPSFEGVGVIEGTDYGYISESLAAIHGCESTETLIGRAWSSLYTVETETHNTEELLRQVSDQGAWRGCAVAHKQRGGSLPVEVWLRPTGGTVTCSVRRQTTADLDESAAMQGYGAVQTQEGIEAVSAPIIVIDQTRELVACNEAAVAFLRTDTRQAVLGRSLPGLVHDRDRVQRRFDRVFGTEATVESGEVRIGASDGPGRVASFVATPVRYQQEPAALIILAGRSGRNGPVETPASPKEAVTGPPGSGELLPELVQKLVGCSSRSEAEQTVCDHLTDSGLYETAWIYSPALDSDGLRRRTTAENTGPIPGAESAAVDIEQTTKLAETAFETNVVQAVPADGSSGNATLAVPVRHETIEHGVLVIRTHRPSACDERERTTLAALGRVIGFLITALRRQALLLTDTVVELTVRIEEPDAVILRASERLGCTLRLAGHVALGDRWLLYLDIDGAAASDVVTALETGARKARVVSDDNQWNRVECVVTDSSVVETITATGVSIRSAQFDEGTGQLVIEAPAETELRELVTQLRRTVSMLEVESVTEHERTPRGVKSPDGLLGALTDRQRDAVTAAYQAGYYDWPRQSTAQEVAGALDIADPTLHGHLRKAESQIFAGLFGSE